MSTRSTAPLSPLHSFPTRRSSDLVAKTARFDGLRYLSEQFLVGPRLGNVIHRAVLEGGARHIDRAVGGDQYDREVRIAAANFLEHVQAVAVGQADVQQQKVEGMLFELGEPGFRGFGAGYAVAFAFQQNLQAFSNLGFVVDDEDGALRHGRLSWPRGTPRGTKCPSRASSARQSFPRAP